MAHTYTIAYSVPAVNLSTAGLQAALAAVPRTLSEERALGLVLASDTTTVTGSIVTRTIAYNSNPGPLGDPGTRDALWNLYSQQFARGIQAPVIAAAPVYT